ncbi:hypothetical protein V1515DRAFT_366867 [Lipomyces mesembrius]
MMLVNTLLAVETTRRHRKQSKGPATRRAKSSIIKSDSDNSSCDDGSYDDSHTDPDVNSDDDTASDSDDDGYADGTRGMVARMRDRWERYCRKKNKKYKSSPDSKWADCQESFLRIWYDTTTG